MSTPLPKPPPGMLHRRLLLASLLPAAALAAGDVRAWYLTPRQVAEQSGLVLIGTLQSARAVPNDQAAPGDPPTPIFTEYQLLVEKVLKGDRALEGRTLALRQTGGTWKGITTLGEPHPDYQPGQRWLLGLVKVPQGWWTTLGIRHGAFRVEGRTATRDYTGFRFVDGKRFPGGRPVETFRLDDLQAVMAR